MDDFSSTGTGAGMSGLAGRSGGIIYVGSAEEASAPGVDAVLRGFVSRLGTGASDALETGRPTGRRRQRRGGGKRDDVKLSDASTPAERYALMRYLDLAEQQAKGLAALVEAGHDPEELADGVRSFKESLRHLWRLRKVRDDEWAEVVNYVQGALSKVAPEQVTRGQASALLAVVRDHLAMAVAEHQPKKVREILRDAGLDPLAPLHILEPKDSEDPAR